MTPGLRLVTLTVGSLFTGYGLYALYSGSVVNTWGQAAHRPSPIYWVTTGAVLLLGVANLLISLRR